MGDTMNIRLSIRLQRKLRYPGLVGLIGGLLLLAAVAIELFVNRPLSANNENLESANQQLAMALQTQPKTEAVDQLPENRVEKVLRDVFASAAANNITLLQGNYSLVQKKSHSSENYQFTFPVSGTYYDTRAFVATLMNTNPTLAIARIKMSRPSIEQTIVESTLHFELFNEGAE